MDDFNNDRKDVRILVWENAGVKLCSKYKNLLEKCWSRTVWEDAGVEHFALIKKLVS